MLSKVLDEIRGSEGTININELSRKLEINTAHCKG
jgi:hypothetical protein